MLALLLAGAAGAFGASTDVPTGKTNAPLQAGKTSSPAVAANSAAAEAPLSPSVFTPLGASNGGQDPFFPKSTRLNVVSVVSTNRTTNVAAELSLNGISGTPARPLAIINSRTFSVGEDGEVPTSAGSKVKILVVEIRFEQQSAIIEVGGERRELKFRGRK